MNTLSPSQQEPPKVVITRSILAAPQRCAIHLLPIAVSSTVIGLNIKGTYLGADMMSPFPSETINLALFQLAAKAHEIMIVASLSVTILHCVRHELLFGRGLPLGFLGSGLAFNNFGYFFSREFYGGLRYVAIHGERSRKAALISLVVVAGLLVTLAGPASAVLLVPKSQPWSAGDTEFFLNGSESDYWPADLSKEIPDLEQLCSEQNSTLLGFCPAGGFHSLWTHWGTMNSTTFQTQNVRSYAKELSGSRFYWPVSSPLSLIPPLYSLGNIQQEPNRRTSLIQPHAATVVMLQRLAEDWWRAFSVHKGLSQSQIDDRTASATFKHAITVARCAAPRKLRASDTTVYFPSIHGRFDFADSLPLDVDSLNSTPNGHLQFQWAHLPPRFGAASIGGLFQTPWKATKGGSVSRIAIGCTVQAGWVPATVFTDKYTFWTGWYPWNIQYDDRSPAWNPTSYSATNGRVAFGDEWLKLLTPPSPLTVTDTASTWRPSTIESIFSNAGLATDAKADEITLDGWLVNDVSSWQRVSLVEAIVCSVILDGLSRTGSHQVFIEDRVAIQPSTTTASTPSESVTITAEFKISGFSLQSSLAGTLAMSVLFTHMAIAIGHIIYLILKRHTPGSCSSVGELIALAQNSPPASEVLTNTGGGIKSSKTYAHLARIRVAKASDSCGQDRIELVFKTHTPSAELRGDSSGTELVDLHTSLLNHSSTRQSQHHTSRNTSPSTQDSIWGLSHSTEWLVFDSRRVASVTTARVQPERSYA
ncbi:uncharacterized protein BO66DRAFT_367623 [Aspergillus aculeatinus CBS 121060]|uniref:Uncharacterized protein n=1 Tax=Aspergillus aculeatinus CBS 121060 TaxID=1448322 RepID=A0ACD1HHG4_9EURO|nr:hypothetical protein BO66DRAFT_367623 [Aspergillus aculeatinus CBS 121060]RAH73102.1 hypothetical protein BO66DRAFT_367623 [Aspergillus aculeatinus CBS 121060]